MILKEAIEKRRSIFPKEYIDKNINEIDLEAILYSADFAPNHKKTKPWRFKVFRKEDLPYLARKVAEIYKNTTPQEIFLVKKYDDIISKIEKSGAIIATSINFSGLVPEWEEVAATAMAVQNMYLTCTSLEIGCYWSTPRYIHYLGDFLELEDNQKCFGLFYLGHYK